MDLTPTGSLPPEGTDQADAARQQGKPKRTYRACQPCRARKLKCDLGDPEAPSDPPCKRCRRESRECVFVLRANAKSYLDGLATNSAEGSPAPPPYTATPPQRPTKRAKTGHTSVSPPQGNINTSVAEELPEPSGSGTTQSTSAQAGPVPTPHLGGWSAPPSTRASYVPTTVASPASESSAQAGPSRLTELYRDTPVASTSTDESGGGGGYDPRNPHFRHPGLARASVSGPPAVGETISSATSTDGYDEEEEESDERGRSRQTGPRGAGSGRDANVLLSSTLHNPSDALRLLATASSLRSAEAFAYKADAMSDSRSRAGSIGRSTERRASSGSRERRRSSRSRERPSGMNPSPLASVMPGDGPLLEEAEEAREGVEPSREEQRSVWQRWVPIQEGMVSISEAEALLAFFKDHMAHLYPLLLDRIFEPVHLPALTSRESLLLAAMITISARYSSLPSRTRARTIHEALAEYCRDELVGILDGSGAMRHISSVEALLLLTEWPPITVGRAQKGNSREREGRSSSRRRTGWGRGRSATRVDQRDSSTGGGGGRAEERVASGSRPRNGFGNSDLDEDGANEENAEALLRSSAQYDGMSWSFIGCAVRLAQELGISNIEFDSAKGTSLSWEEERRLRTWIYCYNADRHVSVRLGRNAVIQAYMSSSWWEQVTNHASHGVRREGGSELWAERTLPQGLIAALMGTIQERLYPNKEITRSMLRTGHWESFIRSLDHELRMMLLKSQNVLQQGNIESTLLQMEFEYVRLYGNAIALRALQERLRRAVKANDLWFVSPSLLNLQEGQWILDALAAAQSILDRTVNFLAPKGYLRLAPSRLHQRILFASTFLFKALAVGVVEHGQSKVLGLLNQTITVLRDNASDRQHIACGFAALLRRLQAQCKPTLFSRFGVRVQNGGDGNADGAVPASAPTPAPVTAAPVDQPSPAPEASQAQGANDPVLAPTPSATGSLPPSAAATPRFNIPGLPPVAESGPPVDQVTGLPLQQQFAPTTPQAQSMSASTPSALPPWLAGAGEPAIEMGGFRLGDVFAPVPMGGIGDPNAHGGMRSMYEWDPMSHSIQVGHEQDLLFQSLWGGGMATGGDLGGMGGANPALNLFGTLVGDE